MVIVARRFGLIPDNSDLLVKPLGSEEEKVVAVGLSMFVV